MVDRSAVSWVGIGRARFYNICSPDLLFPHIENIFSRYEILDPEIAVAVVACSHFFLWCVGRDGLHPACGCCFDMISLV